jgi:CubicO group peptidase (beta-lactamase class C family)
MRKSVYFLPLPGIVLLLSLLFTPVLVSGQGFSPATQARLQAVLETFQNNPANPYVGGMSAAIDIDGQARWKGATGYASRNFDPATLFPLPGGTPFTPDSLSRIYSITKTFTAALILEMVREKQLKLDDAVQKYFPLRQINPSLNNQVTIRHLLSHRSGYSDFVTNPLLLNAVAQNPAKQWTPAEVVASFVTQAIPPDTKSSYSSTNYIILGAIAEKIMGKPIAQLYRTRFFDPLKLKSTYFPPQESIGNRGILVAPHENLQLLVPALPQPVYTNFSFFPFAGIESAAYAGGGIVSSAEDMARWGTALFTGKATSKATLRLMLQSISGEPDQNGDLLGYGIFSTKRISETDEFIGHNGRAPGYRSVMFHQPDKKITIAILSNYAGADSYAVAKALYEALPDFTCGKKENKIQVCWYNADLCVPDKLAKQVIRYGGYLGSCADCGEGSEIAVNARREAPYAREVPDAELTYMKVFPNPVIGRGTIAFTVNKTSQARLEVYNTQGKVVARLFNGEAQGGKSYEAEFDGRTLSSGMYISRLVTGQEVVTQKLIIAR